MLPCVCSRGYSKLVRQAFLWINPPARVITSQAGIHQAHRTALCQGFPPARD